MVSRAVKRVLGLWVGQEEWRLAVPRYWQQHIANEESQHRHIPALLFNRLHKAASYITVFSIELFNDYSGGWKSVQVQVNDGLHCIRLDNMPNPEICRIFQPPTIKTIADLASANFDRT